MAPDTFALNATAGHVQASEWLLQDGSFEPLPTSLSFKFCQGKTSLVRASHYGDGVFETMRCINGQIVLLRRHLARMRHGLQTLGLTPPESDSGLVSSLQTLAQAHGDGVFKLIAASSALGRGYQRAHSRVELALFFSALPTPTASLCVRLASTRTATQPALAGLKHLNRLEQVLACNEPNPYGADEALMCDANDQLVCATSGNLFALIDNTLCTPPLLACGVRGVMRDVVIELSANAGCPVQQRPITWAQLHNASAVFLCNAVRGIRMVHRAVHSDGRIVHFGDGGAQIATLRANALAHHGF
jgi:4-amino-4-deoxychorismate lyase